MKTRTMARATILAAALIVLSGCASAPGSVRASTDADYAALGLSKNGIAVWEDGMRTSGGKGNYEWWYFDSKLASGKTLVIVFYTKNILAINTEIAPFVSVKLTNPDGSDALDRVYRAEPKDFQASREGCDVRIGPNRFSGDLHDYAIHLDFEDIKADISLHGTAPAWRPGTGHSFFSDGSGTSTSYFAWLPAVPQGVSSGSFSYGGTELAVAGSAYHDHNWGNASIIDQMHDWYWGRAEVGPYTAITSYITSSARYGGGAGSTFVLFKDGKLLAEDGAKVSCTERGIYTDAKTGKPVASSVVFEYRDGSTRYRVSYQRERDIANTKFIDLTSGFQRFLASLAGFDGAYLRFTGKVSVEAFEGEVLVDSATEDNGVWELMYLGHAQKSQAAE